MDWILSSFPEKLNNMLEQWWVELELVKGKLGAPFLYYHSGLSIGLFLQEVNLFIDFTSVFVWSTQNDLKKSEKLKKE